MKKRRSEVLTPPEIRCAHTEIRQVAELVPHPRNPNRHPENQVRALARVIQHQGWRNPIVVSARSGYIISGHGRYDAAKLIGIEAVPVDVQDFATEADEWAHLMADNRIAELAEIDKEALDALLVDLDAAGLDTALAGFDPADLELPEDGSTGAPGGDDGAYEKFEVVVECNDEAHQRRIFQELTKGGEKCRLLTF